MDYINSNKLYYSFPYRTTAQSSWLMRDPRTVALCDSIAYPEGGGQLGDRGIIRQGERIVRVDDTQKVGGRVVSWAGFPDVQIECEVQLRTAEDIDTVLDTSQPITIEVDRAFRAAISRSHTAAHLIYIGLLEVVPNARESVRGCFIEPTGGRFDLQVKEVITPPNVTAIQEIAKEWQSADYTVVVESNEAAPECRTWVANNYRIPCGGTHLPSTGLVGLFDVKRRSKGKGLERIYYSLREETPAELLALYPT